MTDLHTHILPGMDDGPREPDQTRLLLQEQCRQGVSRIALTSHYHCEQESAESFLIRRAAAFDALRAVTPEGLTLKLGCEVFFSPYLLQMDLRSLCLEGTNVLLLELPVMQKPAFLDQILQALRTSGIVPLIAHVERYPYVVRDPAILARWIRFGARIQVNAASLTQRNSMAMKLVKWGLVHVIASDTHSPERRPPNLRKSMEAVAKHLGTERARILESNAAAIFCGTPIPDGVFHIPRRVFGIWI